MSSDQVMGPVVTVDVLVVVIVDDGVVVTDVFVDTTEVVEDVVWVLVVEFSVVLSLLQPVNITKIRNDAIMVTEIILLLTIPISKNRNSSFLCVSLIEPANYNSLVLYLKILVITRIYGR
jgi:hypothetical protein